MPRPNSPLTIIRLALTRVIEPHPDIGEAWCIGCSLEPDKIVALMPAEGVKAHAERHHNTPGKDWLRIDTTYIERTKPPSLWRKHHD